MIAVVAPAGSVGGGGVGNGNSVNEALPVE
jgi:hypothetical protein